MPSGRFLPDVPYSRRVHHTASVSDAVVPSLHVSQAGHGQLRFLVNTYSHPCSRQSAHPAVNPSSQTEQRLTRRLTTRFISLSLSSFLSIHHSPAVIHLRKSDFYENIRCFFFQQHNKLSCVFRVYSLTGLMLQLQKERPVLGALSRQTQVHVGWCCSLCLHDSGSLCAAGCDSLYRYKSCVLPFCGLHFSPPLHFQVPATSSLPSLSECFLMSLFSVSESHGRYSRAIRGHQRQFVSFI